MSPKKTKKKSAPKSAPKTGKQLDLETELFRHLTTGDREPALVVLDDDGIAVGTPSKAQLQEYVQLGTIGGRYDWNIGISFEDRYENRFAISLTKKEAQRFLPLL